MIKTISTREVYRNPWTSVREDIIERPNGERGIYGVIDKEDACIVIPLESTPDGDFLWVIAQYRYTVQARFYEFPQGSWELAHIDPEQLARGELKEETGLSAQRMTHLTTYQVAYGVMNQKQHVFLAQGLTEGDPDPDPEETDITLHRIPIHDFEQMLLDGRIVDNCTAAAWCAYRIHTQTHPT